jgi:hypothetical protein
LLQPTLWHETGWPRVNERTLATMELTDSRLELVEIQFEISITDPHASEEDQASPYCKALYQLVEVSVDAFGAPQRRELFAPRLMRPSLAECVGEAWPSELDLDSWGGSPEGARVLMENLVQVVRSDDGQRPVIAFLSDGQAADGGAWHLVMAPIVMGRVRMELAEVVWRGWLVEGDRGCGIRWEAREDSNHKHSALPETVRHAVNSDDFRCGHRDSMERQTTLEAIACCDGPCLIADWNTATDPCGK